MLPPAGVVVVLLLLGGASHAAALRAAADSTDVAAPHFVLSYEGDRLTVHATDVALARLIGALAAETGATVRGGVPDRTVTVDLDRLPLAEGLARLVGAESFMLTYDRDGTLRAIDLLGAGAAASPAPTVSPSPRPPLAFEEEQAAILQRRSRVPRALAEALGGERPPVGRVLHAALLERDAALRAEAREAALAAFDDDPEIESAYLSTLAPVDDVVLARMLRGGAAAPGAAEEWMAALAARASSPALRAKATAVLAELRR